MRRPPAGQPGLIGTGLADAPAGVRRQCAPGQFSRAGTHLTARLRSRPRPGGGAPADAGNLGALAVLQTCTMKSIRRTGRSGPGVSLKNGQHPEAPKGANPCPGTCRRHRIVLIESNEGLDAIKSRELLHILEAFQLPGRPEAGQTPPPSPTRNKFIFQ